MRRRELNHLDEEIAKVQRSTGTLFGFMIPIHNLMRMRFGWYYKWHTTPWAKPLHWLFLLFYISTMGVSFSSLYNPASFKPTQASESYDYARWEWKNPPLSSNTLNKVTKCSDDNSVWIIGNAGTVFRSTDLGISWKQIYSSSSSNLNDVICISADNVIMVGASGTILQYNGFALTSRTSGTTNALQKIIKNPTTAELIIEAGTNTLLRSIDLGNTWSVSSITKAKLRDIGYVTATKLVGCNQGGGTVSNDNGVTWTSLGTTVDYGKLLIVNSDKYICVGSYSGSDGRIAMTVDGGNNWTYKSFAGYGLMDIAKFDDNTYVAVGSFDNRGISLSTVLVTTDGGANWTKSSNPSHKGYKSISILDETHAVALGDNNSKAYTSNKGQSWVFTTTSPLVSTNMLYNLDSSTTISVGASGQASLSSDLGVNWNAIDPALSTNRLLSVAVFDSNHSVVGGENKTIVQTSDKGETWTKKYDSGSGTRSIIKAYNSTQGIAMMSSGLYLLTNDAGETWSTFSNFSLPDLNDLIYLDSLHLIAVSNSGRIIFSTDGGEVWSEATSGISEHLKSVVKLTSVNAVAVGYGGRILVTNDAGATWTPAVSGTTVNFYATSSANNIYYAYGDNCTILNSTDFGDTWNSLYSAASCTFSGGAVNFDDGQHIAVSGGAGSGSSFIYYSDNAGQTWQRIYLTASGSYKITKTGQSSLIAANTDYNSNSIWRSDNYGLTWSEQTLNLYNGTNAVGVFDENNILLIGDNGQILKYHSPANSTATKLLMRLPGQNFSDGSTTGIYGTPNSVQAGQAVVGQVFAVDNSNVLDRGNASIVAFTTTDPNDNNPVNLQLSNDGNCSQNNPLPDYPCGIGSATFTFVTAGTWKISSLDTGSGIPGEWFSSDITVTPASPSKMSLSGASSSTAGTPTGAITVNIQDEFGNTSSVTSDTTINLTSNSSKGYFNTSATGIFDKTSFVIPAGSSSGTFYYLDSQLGTSIITASASGLTGNTKTVDIAAGSISPTLSTVALSSSSVDVSDSDNVNYTVTLKDGSNNPVSGKSIAIYSSRTSDVLSGVSTTNVEGVAGGNFHSQTAGISTFVIYDSTDNVYLELRPQVTFNALAPISFTFSTSSSSIIALNTLGVLVIWKDKFGNYATLSDGKIQIESSDDTTEIARAETMSASKLFGLLNKVYANKSLFIDYSKNDSGKKEFNLSFKKSGEQTIKLIDAKNNFEAEESVLVLPATFSISKSDFSIVTPKMAVNSQTIATAKVTDDFGNPIPGKVIKLNLSKNSDKLSIVSQISTSNLKLISQQYEDNNNSSEISLYNISDSNGLAKYTISSAEELTTEISAKNITDNKDIGKGITLEIVSASLIQTTIDNLRNNEIIQTFNDKIIKPLASIGVGFAGASLLVQAAAAIPQGFHLAAYGLSVLLQTIGFKRKQKPWGLVLDSLTGKAVAMAIVRLYESKSKKLIATAVTDVNGRFEFNVSPDIYHITVTKEKYQFPATFFPQTTLNNSTLPYSDRYLGQTFAVTQENPAINLTIPIDPINPIWNPWMKIKFGFTFLSHYLEVVISYSAVPFLIVGTFLALFAQIVKPSLYSLLILGVYLVLSLITLFGKYLKQNRSFIIYDADTGKPLEKVVIAVFDREFAMLRANLITNAKGMCSVLLRKGAYEIKVDYPNYHFTPSPKLNSKFAPTLKSLTFTIKKAQFLHKSIAMQLQQGDLTDKDN